MSRHQYDIGAASLATVLQHDRIDRILMDVIVEEIEMKPFYPPGHALAAASNMCHENRDLMQAGRQPAAHRPGTRTAGIR